MNRLGVLILAVFLSGCGTGHPLDCATGLVAWNDCPSGSAGFQRRASLEQNDQTKCANYGFQVGTPDYARCIMALDQNRDQSNDALLRSVLGANLANRPATPTPYVVPVNPTVNCTSNRVGNTVNTNCQ
jgi:hypothetical protein